MVAITSVIITNQNTYTETLSLNNVVDEISLLLSQAQIYGVGVKEFVPGSDNFEIGYGLSFNKSDLQRKEFIFFADRNSNERYDSGWSCPISPTSECISKHLLLGGSYISKICYVRNNDTESCTSDGVDISFIRPSTKANLKFFNSAGNSLPTPNLKNAKIEITSAKGQTRTINVYPTGQISAQ